MNFSSPEAKEKYIHSVFTRIAEYYDGMNRIISFNQDRKWRMEAARKMCILPGQVVLDCCCGTGALTCMLLPLVRENGKVIGIDFTVEMLKIAKAKCPEAEYIHGNVLNLPFADNSFDAAAMAFALRNLANQEMAIREMVRVVKTGGSVVILELNRPSMFVFKQVFNLYFNHAVPFLGKLMKDSADSYIYLPQSYSFLPSPDELLGTMEQAGLQNMRMQEMTGGVTAVFWGTK